MQNITLNQIEKVTSNMPISTSLIDDTNNRDVISAVYKQASLLGYRFSEHFKKRSINEAVRMLVSKTKPEAIYTVIPFTVRNSNMELINFVLLDKTEIISKNSVRSLCLVDEDFLAKNSFDKTFQSLLRKLINRGAFIKHSQKQEDGNFRMFELKEFKEKNLPVIKNQKYLLELFKYLEQETLSIPEDFSSITNSKSIQFTVVDCGVVVSIDDKKILLTTEKEHEQSEQNSELKQAIAVLAYFTTLNNLK